jgi:hypothetical protein
MFSQEFLSLNTSDVQNTKVKTLEWGSESFEQFTEHKSEMSADQARRT